MASIYLDADGWYRPCDGTARDKRQMSALSRCGSVAVGRTG